jgi:hypothetical protein
MAINSALSKYGFLGNMIARLISGVASFALAVAVMFAIPVILDEKTGPIETIKTSTKFIIKNWGETFGGFVYTEIIQIILSAIGTLFFLLAFLAAIHLNTISSVGIPVFLLIVLIGIALIFSLSMSTIGSAILFIIFLIFNALLGFSTLALVLATIGLLSVMIGHLLYYVLFNCFKLIVYDYKTRKLLPKGFDKSVIDKGVKWQAGGGSGKQGPLNFPKV